MAGFSERVTIYIETKADNAKSAFAQLKTDIGQAQGGFGKLKTAVGGLGNIVSSAMSPAVLTAGAGALVAVAGKAVGAFEDLGTTIGKFRDATGTTSEQASRLVEVFDDLGVAPDQAASAIGRMEKTLATNADALEKWGIAAVKAKDGTTDVNATFLAAVDTISKIKNPTDQAAAAQATFGKSWQSMAEIIKGGAGPLAASLAAVQNSKVFNDADIQRARDLRDAMDSVKDAGEGVMLTLGKSLAPAIIKIGPAIAGIITKAEPLIQSMGQSFSDAAESAGEIAEALGPVIGLLAKAQGMSFDIGGGNNLKPLGGGLAIATTLAGAAKDAYQNLTDVQLKSSVGWDTTTKGAKDAGVAAEEAAAKAKWLEDAQKGLDGAMDVLNKTLQLQIDSLKEATDALAAQADGYTSAADDQLAYNRGLDEFNKLAKDGKTTTDQLADAAIGAAKDHAALYESLTTAAGGVVTITGRLDAQNSTLLATARTASGPARQAILDYTFALNGIPEEKKTAIIAAIAAGDLAEAQRLLDEASAPRKASMVADANNAALDQTNRDLDGAAHDRTVKFNAQAVGLGALTGAFAGAVGAAGGSLQGASATALSGAAPVMYTTNVTNNVTVPRIPSGRELARVAERWSRVDGRR